MMIWMITSMLYPISLIFVFFIAPRIKLFAFCYKFEQSYRFTVVIRTALESFLELSLAAIINLYNL